MGDGADHALLAAARAGEESAFSELYARHLPDARRFARRLLGPGRTADADDVVNTAFEQVLKAVRRGRGPVEHLRPYLLVTVRHIVWREQALHRRERGTALEVASEATTAGEADRAPDVSLDGWSRPLLEAAYLSLPLPWQEILWLVEVEGRSPSELVDLLGGPANRVAALTYRARRGLRRAYYLAYRDEAPTPACARYASALADRDSAGIDAMAAHHATCSTCRSVRRGVEPPRPGP